MNAMMIVGVAIKALDFLHDILCPFFKDDNKSKQQQKILQKIKSLQEQLSTLKKKKNK